jgi:hypothetical protein
VGADWTAVGSAGKDRCALGRVPLLAQHTLYMILSVAIVLVDDHWATVAVADAGQASAMAPSSNQRQLISTGN